ncbi:hypothetical protein TNCV_83361 [Trichonephila clavipes]|nr:hypothetical protein TNCV_83361 [Trichonephila clavipes]
MYPQKEQPKTRQTHLVQQNKLARLTWRSKINSKDSLGPGKSSKSRDATLPITAMTAHATYTRHNNYIVYSPNHRLISGGICNCVIYIYVEWVSGVPISMRKLHLLSWFLLSELCFSFTLALSSI